MHKPNIEEKGRGKAYTYLKIETYFYWDGIQWCENCVWIFHCAERSGMRFVERQKAKRSIVASKISSHKSKMEISIENR